MTRLVMLLRGVNVGGNRKLPMTALRRGLEAAECADVVSYIQSGNVAITPPTSAPNDLQTWLEQVVAGIAGFDVPVVLRTLPELERTVERNPYPHAGGTRLHVMFFSRTPERDLFDGIEAEHSPPEAVTLLDRDLYLYLLRGIGRAKLPSAIDRAARRSSPPIGGTTRNWNTVLKLVELARGPHPAH